MHPALVAIAEATRGSSFENDLWLVGGAVRDELLSIPHENDFDLVTRGSSAELAHLLRDKGLSSIPPVTYERFGTAMVHVHGTNVEIVTARRESYEEGSRKPTVEAATYEEDAARRDFTVNTLMRSIHSEELWDPLGNGLDDLKGKVLRTPLDPGETFRDDPLRMLRAVRFRWKLGFEPAEGLYDSILATKQRLKIISNERIRDELLKMLQQPTASEALNDLMNLGLIEIFAPELVPMKGCEQGKWHHLDVWDHSLLVLKNAGTGDIVLSLAALLHDVGKPATRIIDEKGDTRFFSHEVVGADIAAKLLRRLRIAQNEIDQVVPLVRNHMRLGSFETFTPAAARRLVRDLGDQTERLLTLVEADANALKAGVRTMDLQQIRSRLAETKAQTPREALESPLSGEEIMEFLQLSPGRKVGELKNLLAEKVIEGELQPNDKEAAKAMLTQEIEAKKG
ncbi:MAG: CCA tRNA nucleotidyltransferase [Fimbriimonas sp.]